MENTAFDVVVVGGGLAGLACAIRCAEQGIGVAVLERGTDELYACNSRFANGFINVGSEYIHAPPERLRQVIDRQTYGFARAPLAETLSRNAAPAVRWLAGQGVRMVEIHGGSPIRRTVLAPPP
jgi:phytoene dehydrogenase-like protein